MLPKTIFVKVEDDSDNSYLLAEYNPKDLIDLEDEDGTEVGEYKLVRKSKYTFNVQEIKG